MEISPLLLSTLLLCSFLWGGAVGILNDINRIIRVFFGVRYTDRNFEKIRSQIKIKEKINENSENQSNKKPISDTLLNVIIFIQDLLLMCVSGAGIVILNFYFNDGRFRFFTVMAAIAGFLLYYFTVGKLMMLISEPITLIIRFVLHFAVRCFIFPFKIAFRLLSSLICKILNRIKKGIAKRRNMRYNIKKSKEFRALSEIGFLESELGSVNIK